jgi:hypothetical protein
VVEKFTLEVGGVISGFQRGQTSVLPLIKAHIRTADELRDLWASPKAKDKLRRRNRNLELMPSYAENTDILDQYL